MESFAADWWAPFPILFPSGDALVSNSSPEVRLGKRGFIEDRLTSHLLEPRFWPVRGTCPVRLIGTYTKVVLLLLRTELGVERTGVPCTERFISACAFSIHSRDLSKAKCKARGKLQVVPCGTLDRNDAYRTRIVMDYCVSEVVPQQNAARGIELCNDSDAVGGNVRSLFRHICTAPSLRSRTQAYNLVNSSSKRATRTHN